MDNKSARFLIMLPVVMASAASITADEAQPLQGPEVSAEAEIGAVEAAELAADIKEETASVTLTPVTEADDVLQGYVTQISAIGALLEAQIASGRSADETRALYTELRRLRLEVLELVRSGKAQLPVEATAQFEELLAELGRYYRE